MLASHSKKEPFMKYFIRFSTALTLLVLGVGVSPLFAEPTSTPTTAPAIAGNRILSAGGAADFPLTNWNPAYTIGIGSLGELSFPLDPNWTWGFWMGYFHYQGNDFSGPVIIDEVRIIPMVRFYPAVGGVSPYLTGGLGVAAQFVAVSGTITPNLNPDGFVGAGFEARLTAQEAVFFEADYNLIIAGGGTLTQDAVA